MKITVTFTIEEPAMKEFLENPSVIAYYEKLAEKDFSLNDLDEDVLFDIAFEYFDDLYEYADAPEWKIIK